jgi:hypothetical protein
MVFWYSCGYDYWRIDDSPYSITAWWDIGLPNWDGLWGLRFFDGFPMKTLIPYPL